MLSYQCHPAVEELLKKLILNKSNDIREANIHFITTYLPPLSDIPHEGINRAVQYRLENRNTHIILLSFLPKEEILKHDNFGLLSLQGAFFLRLPFGKAEWDNVLSQCTYPLIIPNREWEAFATEVYKSQLKGEISKLRHGGTLDIGNRIIYPLRIACLGYQNNPDTYLPLIEKQLENLRIYINTEEISSLIRRVKLTESLENGFLCTLQSFVNSLEKLSGDFSKNTVNVVDILHEINNFMAIYNTLIQ